MYDSLKDKKVDDDLLKLNDNHIRNIYKHKRLKKIIQKNKKRKERHRQYINSQKDKIEA